MAKVRKERLDLLMVERGLVESRQRAQRLIMAGQVAVGDRTVDKPGTRVPIAADLEISGGLPYASRGGYKLAAALEAFDLAVEGRTAADVGASTGGFTDCLLQRGAAQIYAIDVGYGQLAWKLQQDPRVIVMDRTNARYLEHLPAPVDLVVIDVSFISLKLILPAAAGWLAPGGQIVALIKPQFEAGRKQVGKGGVVRDPAIHRAVLADLLGWAQARGLGLMGLIPSPITGAAGNVEFLAHWIPGRPAASEIGPSIEACMPAEEAPCST
ncbi:MAG: TlyA family RNA methyltransferase [Anaerolineae bacterium]|jgi:23S rRNA (cytidine1920-2'-O)/16S rRNA (cytidine1409-2'-O)-methyltransferase